MQEKTSRRSNAERRQDMRARLIQAARAVFVEKGFAETGTPEIVRRAEVTRGALYHHFEDKADLFRAVVTQEAEALGQEIEEAAKASPDDGLMAGTEAFFAAMAAPGRVQLLLIDGPAVLGPEEMDRIDAGGGRRTLKDGLVAADPDRPTEEVEALAILLSAAFDRAALAVAKGAAAGPYIAALALLMGKA